MALRLVKLTVPAEERERAKALVEEHGVFDIWWSEERQDRAQLEFLAESGAVEELVDALDRSFGETEGFRLVLLAVEVTLPRPTEDAEGQEEEEEEKPPPARIGREELYADLLEVSRLTPTFAVMTALSVTVCAFGLLMGDVAVIIGAMVIAPLLGPLVALSLATTLADAELARAGIHSSVAGAGVAVLLSVGTGLVFSVDPSLPEMASRSSVTLGHVGLALAAGSAGTLAFTSGTATAVIGVMVAVALVPPLVAGGLLLGDGHMGDALGAYLLTLTNLICINLAGVATFLIQGIRPNRWWEEERARRSARIAIALWSALLLLLVAVILWDPTGSGA